MTVTPVTPAVFSSGKHNALNTQPWAIIATRDGEEMVEGRYADRRQGEADLELFGKDTPDRLVWDPNPIDSAPLHNVPNPILADLRDGDETETNKALDWWDDVLNNTRAPKYWTAHQRHAARVIHLVRYHRDHKETPMNTTPAEIPPVSDWLDHYELRQIDRVVWVVCTVCGDKLTALHEDTVQIGTLAAAAHQHQILGHRLPQHTAGDGKELPVVEIRQTGTDENHSWMVWIRPTKPEHYDVDPGVWPTLGAAILAPYGDTYWASYEEAAEFLARNLPEGA